MKFIKIARYKRLKNSGVYILWFKDNPIYIGQTQYLETRLSAHRNKDWDAYSFIHENDAEKRGKLESDLIRKLKPQFNKNDSQITYTETKKDKRRKLVLGILKADGPMSSRQMQRRLRIKYNVIINHNTVNNDMKELKK